jgi:hypothetical protein
LIRHRAIRALSIFHCATEANMKANVGGIDKIARILVGIVLIGLAATGTVGAWGWIGLLPLATGLMGWCPAYTLFGLNSCPLKK